MCRSRRELSNAYLLAKFGFDTAENEPFQVCPLSVYRLLLLLLQIPQVWDVDKVEMCRDRDVLPKCKACAADLKRKDAPEVCTDFAYQGVTDFNT